MKWRRIAFPSLLLLMAVLVAGCAGPAGEPGPAGPSGPAGPPGPAGPALEAADLTCTECHNDGSYLTGKRTAWSESLHGTNGSYVRGTRSGCAGCHSGGGFSAMIAAGLNPGTVEAGDPDPTRQDCRACHAIHTTFTTADWALETTDPVAFYAVEGETFDGGKGNLCVNCHQARSVIGAAVDGEIEVEDHWGPHHGPQSAMLLGLVGAGAVGSPSPHALMVENTCVSCHMGEGKSHTFEPSVAACTGCHPGVEDFDINGVQTDVQTLLDQVEEALIAKGMLDEEGEPVVGSYPEAQAAALWDWIYVAQEDKSLGVHNSVYTKALLEAALAALE